MEKCRNCGASAVGPDGRCTVCHSVTSMTASPSTPAEAEQPGVTRDLDRFAAPVIPMPEQTASMHNRPVLLGAIGLVTLLALGGLGLVIARSGASDQGTEQPDLSISREESDAGDAGDDHDPLGIGLDFRNLPNCTGEFVVMLATAGRADEYSAKLAVAASGLPEAHYLQASDSCDAFLDRDPDTGELIYNAYLGPFRDAADACAALDSIPSDKAWVRELSHPSKERALCMCNDDAVALPELGGPGMPDPAVHLPTRRHIAQVQWVLYLRGLNDRDSIYGNATARLSQQVGDFQQAVGLPRNGVVGAATWRALQADYCPASAYLKDR